jgi:hypothetical protein
MAQWHLYDFYMWERASNISFHKKWSLRLKELRNSWVRQIRYILFYSINILSKWLVRVLLCAKSSFLALFRSHDTLWITKVSIPLLHHVTLGRSDVLGFAVARSAFPWVNRTPIWCNDGLHSVTLPPIVKQPFACSFYCCIRFIHGPQSENTSGHCIN